jgi:hypothetical protein
LNALEDERVRSQEARDVMDFCNIKSLFSLKASYL